MISANCRLSFAEGKYGSWSLASLPLESGSMMMGGDDSRGLVREVVDRPVHTHPTFAAELAIRAWLAYLPLGVQSWN
jgi:hypothetical protein